MAQPWVTGPGHMYVGISGGNAPVYLGVCKTTPRINFTPRFSQVMSDTAGDQIPHDWIYSGKDANLFGDLTVWNWTTLLGVMARPNPVITGFVTGLPPGFGTDSANLTGVGQGSRGTLMVTEGWSYTLWVQFPYASKSAFGGFMPAGFRFPTSFLIGPDDFDMGTKANEIRIAFHMASKQAANGDWVLCDGNMTALPATPPTTLS